MLHKFAVELAHIAAEHSVETAALMAIVEVESNGVLFANVEGRSLPVIRWEGHYFDRLVPAHLRAEARKAGLAHPSAGAVKNPASQASRYRILQRAIKIDRDAALQSISIGVGQVMISHWKTLGYANPSAMFKRACEGFEGQVELMMRYIVKFDLLDEMQRLDWAGFARGYNGPAYKKNKYDTKMASAYRRYSGQTTPVSPASGMLRLGSKGARVRELQQLLVRAGVTVKVDGDYGPATKAAVKEFQAGVGITADGVAGPETMAALSAYRSSPDEKLGIANLMDIDEVRAGIGSAIGGGGATFAIQQAATQLHDIAGDVMIFKMIAAGLMTIGAIAAVGGVLWGVWGWIKSKRTFEGLT